MSANALHVVILDVVLISGKQPEAGLRDAVTGILHRLHGKAHTLGLHFQISPQLGLALPDPVSKLALVERGEIWAGELAPGHSLQFFQRMDVAT
jgi:hypothetical protein